MPAVTIERVKAASLRDGVSLRTNRRLVVLNDLDGGEVWDLDSKPLKIDEWESLIPPPQDEKKNDKKEQNLIDQASTAQPPKAEPDNLKARPGRTSKLHVLDNDTDSTGAILAIDPADLGKPDLEGVSVSVAADGQSVDVTIPRDPRRQSFSFTYKVNNGMSPEKSQATVSVGIASDQENTPPAAAPRTGRAGQLDLPRQRGQAPAGAGHRRLARPRERHRHGRGDRGGQLGRRPWSPQRAGPAQERARRRWSMP